MSTDDTTGRRRFLKWSSCLAAQVPLAMIAAPALASAQQLKKTAQIQDALIKIDIDAVMHTRISYLDGPVPVPLSGNGSSEFVVLEGGKPISEFALFHVEEQGFESASGPGRRLVVSGISGQGLQKTVSFVLLERHPGFVQCKTSYQNLSQQTIALQSWVNGACRVHAKQDSAPAFWSFSGASYPDRRDWVQPVHDGFGQNNFMGMNGSDYGGGTPVVDVWRRDGGVAVGHLETVPLLVSLPIKAATDAVSISVTGECKALEPAAVFTTPTTFIAAHHGDYFATLNQYRLIMADLGLHAAPEPQTAYQPIWCAWGYEREFSMALVQATLGKAKQLGLEWAVIDDGWQTRLGDWQVDQRKFPRGVDDLKGLASQISAAGLKPRLWFSPLAVAPGSDVLHDHTDMLLLDKDGAVQNISWWNCFYLCPAYQPTVDYTKKLIRMILADWGFLGLKLDGQHLNGVAPCYNPAHNHARPEESVEKLQDFFRAIYDTAMEVNPEAVIELCPCGTSFAFHNIAAMNQTPASDPLSSWQVRHKGKTLKALMGRSAAFAGDHVELSDGGNDFASTVGTGAIVSTKFTWPVDPKPKDSFLLTPDREKLWEKWIGLYNRYRLPTGRYLGELYDIGFDVPETHAIEKDGCMYYALYAPHWHGPVELRGLDRKTYQVTDYVNNTVLGQVSRDKSRLIFHFEHALLLEVKPV